jgi:hypothetical protein
MFQGRSGGELQVHEDHESRADKVLRVEINGKRNNLLAVCLVRAIVDDGFDEMC